MTAFDVVGPLDLGSPACCSRAGGCNPNDFNLQTIWNYATSTGLNLATYGNTAIAWPPMAVGWAGLGLVHDYGDYTCWAYVTTSGSSILVLPNCVYDALCA